MVYDKLYGVREDPFEELHEGWYAALEALTMLRPYTAAGRLAKLRVAREAMASTNPEMMNREVFVDLIVLDELLADADCTGEMSWLGLQPLSSPSSNSPRARAGRPRRIAGPGAASATSSRG